MAQGDFLLQNKLPVALAFCYTSLASTGLDHPDPFSTVAAAQLDRQPYVLVAGVESTDTFGKDLLCPMSQRCMTFAATQAMKRR